MHYLQIFASQVFAFLLNSLFYPFMCFSVGIDMSSKTTKTYHYPAKEDNQNNIPSIVRFS